MAGIWCCPAASKITPRACPTAMAVLALVEKNKSSMARQSGLWDFMRVFIPL